jgi:hypothetical protein
MKEQPSKRHGGTVKTIHVFTGTLDAAPLGEEVGRDTQAVGYLCSAQSCNMFTVEAFGGAFARYRVLLGPYIMPCA